MVDGRVLSAAVRLNIRSPSKTHTGIPAPVLCEDVLSILQYARWNYAPQGGSIFFSTPSSLSIPCKKYLSGSRENDARSGVQSNKGVFVGRVVVVGSINQDITVTVERFPEPGETLSGTSVHYRLGGKGANQSAAAAYGGATTIFVGRVGDDASGPALRQELASHGVDVSNLLTDEDTTTGIAFITVASSGENTIILDAGANGHITAAQAREAVELTTEDVVVLQGEIPPQTNAQVIDWAKAAGARILMNLAPVYDIDPTVLARVDVLVVNESEAGLLLGTQAPTSRNEALEAARTLHQRGIRCVFITLGKEGGVWAGPEGVHFVESLKLGTVVDTTGAGDASVGVLAAALAAGYDFASAAREGMRAGSTAVLNAGAAASYSTITPVPALN